MMSSTIPETRQGFLNEAVAAASQITETDIASVINSIVDLAKEESKKSDAYGKMFEASHKGLRGVLSEANHQMTQVVLDTMDVMEEKGLLKKGGDDYVKYNQKYKFL